MSISVSYKPFGDERGQQVGEVLVIDSELLPGGPVPSADASEDGEVTAILVTRGDTPGITELGLMTRRKAESVAAEHGVPLTEH